MRARWVKPEFFNDKKMGVAGPVVALVYQSLWIAADDSGTVLADPERLKGLLFMYWSAIGVPEITESLQYLSDSHRIRLFNVEDTIYATIVTWNKHQKVHKPSAFRHPQSGQQLTSIVPHSSGTTPNIPKHPHNSPPPRHLDVLDTKTPRHLDSYSAVSGETGREKSADVAKARKSSRGYSPEFEAIWLIYPHPPGDSKADAARAYTTRRRNHDQAVIHAGVERYRAYCEASGSIGTKYCKQGVTFFGPGLHFLSDWVYCALRHPERRLSAVEQTRANLAGLGEAVA